MCTECSVGSELQIKYCSRYCRDKDKNDHKDGCDLFKWLQCNIKLLLVLKNISLDDITNQELDLFYTNNKNDYKVCNLLSCKKSLQESIVCSQCSTNSNFQVKYCSQRCKYKDNKRHNKYCVLLKKEKLAIIGIKESLLYISDKNYITRKTFTFQEQYFKNKLAKKAKFLQSKYGHTDDRKKFSFLLAVNPKFYGVDLIPTTKINLEKKIKKDITICFVCQKTEGVKLCKECGGIFYCSTVCQKKDRFRHKKNCIPANICFLCKNKGNKRCVRCKNTFYCSRKCQTQDWPRHKENCNQIVQKGKQKT